MFENTEVFGVHREDRVEAPEIGGNDLSGAIMVDDDAVAAGGGAGAPVRRFADVPSAGAGTVDHDVEPTPLGLGTKRRLGQGRATDVAEADEEDGGGQSLRNLTQKIDSHINKTV